MISQRPDSDESVASRAKNVLSNLVEAAKQEGVSCHFRLAYGKSWVQIIRQVINGEHDLVVVGTRDLDPVRRFFLGSTAIKLLRKCPCPVWVTKPQLRGRVSCVLVATDFTPVSDLAMDLGASMAQQNAASLCVSHVLEYPEQKYLRQSHSTEETILKYQEEFRAAAEKRLAAQLQRPAFRDLPEKPQVIVSEGPAADEILSLIEHHKVGLLVMGTVQRGGVRGVLVGSTAEELLPQIPCSVLAVKPDDFQCPIRAD
jgi:universal stress protein E